MDYSKLSDFEINGRVARATQKIGDFTQARGKTLIHDYEDVGEFKNICIGWKEFDPCNNPADAWPIIQKSGISLVYDGDDWLALHFSRPSLTYPNDHRKHPDKPFRAALILWLMMQESE
ncbi:putative NinX protein [Erwinia phage Midgardsormr38]|uniref:Putative NinX protein n=1 Tax=Erwinia phage Midgardsormr38 TaxID=2663326 RepID=A0A5Q2FBZ3_9CAUD|nr:putative NinX protein [Erwinia phage Midgardsormr38]QGF22026.1 putative NinX protein [Erwinia phage Midgardsormr38]